MKIDAKSEKAIEAKVLVEALQSYFVDKLDALAKTFGEGKTFQAVEWLRDEGIHGGGVRFESRDENVFNRASVNTSQVHYDDDSNKKLGSATAISCIIHPSNPHASSMHMHFSWTEMKNGQGYWRLMADLNPSLAMNFVAKEMFTNMLKEAAGEKYLEEGLAQGNRYFDIPVLKRTRGVAHFYLENFNDKDFETDKAYVEQFAKKVIDVYIEIVQKALEENSSYTQEEREIQIDYHTLYLFQVLTLDRGTTSGLLVHNQNDVGIMGSIPSHVNSKLLASWIEQMPKPQDELLENIVKVLGNGKASLVDEEKKKKLAEVVRLHYTKYPEALSMQASGEIVPSTVDNHA